MPEEKVDLQRFDRILLIEDDPSHAMIVQRVLRGFTTDLVHAPSASAATQALNASPFSLIVSDLHLPDLSELALVEKILSLAGDAPIVVLTSSTSLPIAVEAMKLGAKDFIVKNFNADFREVFSLAIERTARAMLLERERRRLQHEMAVLRIAIENGVDGLAIINKDGTIDFANVAFKDFVKLWGGEPSSLVTAFSGRVEKGAALIHALREKITSSEHTPFWSTEMSLEGDKSTAYRVDIGSIFGKAPHGDEAPVQWVLWIRDISDIKRREKFQRELLSTTTHDLKGPLGAIMLSSELITNAPENVDRVRELALRIGSSAASAVNLIDEFLSARRIQEGTLILKPTSHEVAALLDDVLQNYETMAKAKSIALSWSCSPQNFRASFDRLAMTRVLGNLITNAIKFTQKGGAIQVAARQSQDEWTLAVIDNGSGMEPHEVKKLFERFSRLNRHAEVAGTGLGLFVVRCIVNAHSGRISISSQPGAGSAFEISLPLEPPTGPSGEVISLDLA